MIHSGARASHPESLLAVPTRTFARIALWILPIGGVALILTLLIADRFNRQAVPAASPRQADSDDEDPAPLHTPSTAPVSRGAPEAFQGTPTTFPATASSPAAPNPDVSLYHPTQIRAAQEMRVQTYEHMWVLKLAESALGMDQATAANRFLADISDELETRMERRDIVEESDRIAAALQLSSRPSLATQFEHELIDWAKHTSSTDLFNAVLLALVVRHERRISYSELSGSLSHLRSTPDSVAWELLVHIVTDPAELREPIRDAILKGTEPSRRATAYDAWSVTFTNATDSELREGTIWLGQRYLSEEPLARQGIINTLQMFGSPNAVDTLISLSSTEPQATIRASIINAVDYSVSTARIRAPDVWQRGLNFILDAAAGDPDSTVRQQAESHARNLLGENVRIRTRADR